MIKKIIWGCVFVVIAGLLQSTIFSRLIPNVPVVPDLALCIIVYIAYVNGLMTGQLTGFFSGLLLDFFSAAPLGLNAFVRTITGALAGFLKGTFYLDYIFLPMALCAAATLLKAAIFFLLNIFFPGTVPVYMPDNPVLWIELGMNTLIAPFIFALLRLFKPLAASKKENI